MIKFAVYKNNDQAIIPTQYLYDKNLSLEEKGLLTILFSLNNCFLYPIEKLSSLCRENAINLDSVIDELERKHYIRVKRTLDNDGNNTLEYYEVFEEPYFDQKENIARAKIIK